MIDPNDASYRPIVDAELSTGNTVLRAFRAAGVILAAAPLVTTASAASMAGLRIPHGVAPTTPTNGDLWTTAAGVFARINGATVSLAATTSASDLTTGILAYARLPTGSGSWDTGAGTTLTLTRAAAFSSTVAVTGQATFSGLIAHGNTRYTAGVKTLSVGTTATEVLVLATDFAWVFLYITDSGGAEREYRYIVTSSISTPTLIGGTTTTGTPIAVTVSRAAQSIRVAMASGTGNVRAFAIEQSA